MSSINENNFTFSATSPSVRIGVGYFESSSHEDIGSGINIDLDHAIAIRPSADIVISVRSEKNGLWTDISIAAGERFRMNVSNYDLLNFRLAAPSGGKAKLIRFRSLRRSYQLNSTLEQKIDDAVSIRRFEFLPKITVVAS